ERSGALLHRQDRQPPVLQDHEHHDQEPNDIEEAVPAHRGPPCRWWLRRGGRGGGVHRSLRKLSNGPGPALPSTGPAPSKPVQTKMRGMATPSPCERRVVEPKI